VDTTGGLALVTLEMASWTHPSGAPLAFATYTSTMTPPVLSTVCARAIAVRAPSGLSASGPVQVEPSGSRDPGVGRLVTTYVYACEGPLGERLPSLFWHRV